MNILFFYTEAINPTKGGVERVTFSLSNFFCSKGYNVYFVALHRDNEVDDPRQLYLPCADNLNCYENLKYMRNFAIANNISIVINQGALNPESADFIVTCGFENVKIISVIHNSLLSVADNFGLIYEAEFKRRNLGFLSTAFNTSFSKKIFRFLYKCKKKTHYRKLIAQNDALVLLSETYKKELTYLTGVSQFVNVIAIPNPTNIPSENYNKENIVLYVGRINNTQKRVGKLVDIWANTEHPNWKLVIIGEGEYLDELKEKVLINQISNVIFTGRCNPIDYYKRSSIFCLTSSFEGLPMTLIESLSYGVIPIVYDTFSSASDIIEDSYNGFLISENDDKSYSDKLYELITNPKIISELKKNCIKSSVKYDIEVIGNKWIKLFKAL